MLKSYPMLLVEFLYAHSNFILDIFCEVLKLLGKEADQKGHLLGSPLSLYMFFLLQFDHYQIIDNLLNILYYAKKEWFSPSRNFWIGRSRLEKMSACLSLGIKILSNFINVVSNSDLIIFNVFCYNIVHFNKNWRLTS